jgi:hypothetical protein
MTNTDAELESYVRRALIAAADGIQPACDQLEAGGRRNVWRRWVPALVAATAVVAIAIAATVMLDQNHQRQEALGAGIPMVSDGVARLDGINFMVPAGWTVRIVNHDTVSSTVCIEPMSPTKTGPCTAVAMRVALAQQRGSTTPLPQNPLYFESPDRRLTVESLAPIGGRPGAREHLTFAAPIQAATVWRTNDLAFEVSVRGEGMVLKAEQIVNGVDFSGWLHHFGPASAGYGVVTSR